MIDRIKEWLNTCEYLKPFLNETQAKIEIERSNNLITNYQIEVAPVDPIVTKYIDGSCIRQTSIEFKCFTKKLGQELSNQLHLENIVKWIEEQNNGDLPSGFREVSALTNGYVYSQTENEQKAIYIISINIEYYSEV